MFDAFWTLLAASHFVWGFGVACQLAVFAGYLASRFRSHETLPHPTIRRICVLIAARNEEKIIAKTVREVLLMDYPNTHFDVYLVADNCNDQTAERASIPGVTVFERNDLSKQRKSYAIDWLCTKIEERSIVYDAAVVLDAESRPNRAFLHAMNHEMERGFDAIQGRLEGSNHSDNGISALAAWIFLINNAEYKGRNLLGWTAQLHGTAFCMTWETFQRCYRKSFSLADDDESLFRLLSEGTKVTYANDAVVHEEVPTHYTIMAGQRMRWLRGRIEIFHLYLFGERRSGIGTFSPKRLAALCTSLKCPRSIKAMFVMLVVACDGFMALHGASGWLIAASVLLPLQVAYYFVLLLMEGVRLRQFTAIIFMPIVLLEWIRILATFRRWSGDDWIPTPHEKK